MKVLERITFRHPGTLQTRSARLKQNPSDTAQPRPKKRDYARCISALAGFEVFQDRGKPRRCIVQVGLHFLFSSVAIAPQNCV